MANPLSAEPADGATRVKARILGQTLGASLVAACFAFADAGGPALALAIGAAFAGVASVVSFVRLRVRPEAM